LCLEQGVEPASCLLCRAGAEIGSKRASQSPIACVLLANRERPGRFRVQSCGDARRHAALGYPGHGQRSPDGPDRHLDHVSRTNDFRGFYALPVQVHSPTEYGLARRTTRLEQACCPEPLIDPHLVHDAMIAGAWPRGSEKLESRRGPRPAARPVCGTIPRSGLLDRRMIAGVRRNNSDDLRGNRADAATTETRMQAAAGASPPRRKRCRSAN